MRGSRRNGVTSVTFRRPLQTNEPVNDLPFRVGQSGKIGQSVIAAIGLLNSRKEANKHNARDHSMYDQKIDFSAMVRYFKGEYPNGDKCNFIL